MRTVKSAPQYLILGLRRVNPDEDEADMRKSITALRALVLAGAASLALAQGELTLRDNAPDRHVVQRGDTLWSIATKFLKDPWRWPEIWRMNQEQIRNPHLISPGDMLAKEAIPAIPLKAIEPFLTQPLLIEEGGLDKAPRIIATEENRVNVGAGNVAYVSGFGGADIPVWQVYRAGRPLVDPDSRRTLGFEAVFLGTARVTQSGEPATVQILDSKKEISAGDRLIPAPPPTIAQYVPRAPASAVNGRIMGLCDALATSVGGRDSIISINRGSRDGLEPGNVLAVYRNVVIYNQRDYLKSRDRSPAIQLPPERYGLVFIFRTFNSVSYALVMESSRPIQPGDIVLNP